MVLAPFVNYNMVAKIPFCAEAAQFVKLGGYGKITKKREQLVF